MNHLKLLCHKVVKSKASNSFLGLTAFSKADQQSCSIFKHVRFFGVLNDGPIEETPDVHFEKRVKEFCKERGIALTDANIMGLDIESAHTSTAIVKFLQPASSEWFWQIDHLDKSGVPKDSRLFGNQFANMCIRYNIVGVVVGYVPGQAARARMESFLTDVRTDHWVQGMPYTTQIEIFTSRDAKSSINHTLSSPSHEAELDIKDWEKQSLNALKNNQSALLILESYLKLRQSRENI